MTTLTFTTKVAAFSLLFCSSTFAQTIHIQVDVDASNLHVDTESVKVLCVLENEKKKVRGYAKLRVKNARARDTVQVPVTVDQDIDKYETVSCSLQVCKKGRGDNCQTPLPKSKVITTSEGYRAYDDSEKNRLSAQQPVTDLKITLTTSSNPDVTGTTISGKPPLEVDTTAVTGEIPTSGTGVVDIDEETFQPVTIDVGQMSGTGNRFQPVTVEVGQMSGTGNRFQPVTIEVGQMSGMGNKFQPVTIEVGQMTGSGTWFEPVIINTDQMVGTGIANLPHTITLNKSGSALGRMFALLDGSSIAATCLANCTTATSDAIEHGATVTISANEENLSSYQFGDDTAVFSGWEGDAICVENANGNETSFPLNDDVTCTARFDLLPFETATITLKKVSNSKTKGDGILRATILGDDGTASVVAFCPVGCNEVISDPLPVGTIVTVAQYSNEFNNFIGWTEELDCSNSITLASNTTCSAAFNKVPLIGPTLTLVKAGEGNGIIEVADLRCDLDCTTIVVNNTTSSFDFTQGLAISIRGLADKFSRTEFTGACLSGSTGDTASPVITQDTTCFVKFNKKPIKRLVPQDLQPLGFTLHVSKEGPTRGELNVLFENKIVSRCNGGGVCNRVNLTNRQVGVGRLELDGTKTITLRAYTHSWTVARNDDPLDTVQMTQSVVFTHFSGDELCTAGVNPEKPNETTIPMSMGLTSCTVNYDYPPPEPNISSNPPPTNNKKPQATTTGIAPVIRPQPIDTITTN